MRWIPFLALGVSLIAFFAHGFNVPKLVGLSPSTASSSSDSTVSEKKVMDQVRRYLNDLPSYYRTRPEVKPPWPKQRSSQDLIDLIETGFESQGKPSPWDLKKSFEDEFGKEIIFDLVEGDKVSRLLWSKKLENVVKELRGANVVSVKVDNEWLKVPLGSGSNWIKQDDDIKLERWLKSILSEDNSEN